MLLKTLSLRFGRIDRGIYDENGWAPAPLHLMFGGRDVILDGCADQSINTLSVIGEQFGKLVLPVVHPYTADPTGAYTTVMTAASPDNVSTADELLGILGSSAAESYLLRRSAAQSC